MRLLHESGQLTSYPPLILQPGLDFAYWVGVCAFFHAWFHFVCYYSSGVCIIQHRLVAWCLGQQLAFGPNLSAQRAKGRGYWRVAKGMLLRSRKP